MAAGQAPIFVATPKISGITTGTSANTNKDGTGTVATVITAGANGSKLDRVFIQHMGSNVATVLRFFVNNGSSNATPANNFLIHEEVFSAWTNSETGASTSTVWCANLVLAAGYKLNVVTATAIASGFMVCGEGGDF